MSASLILPFNFQPINTVVGTTASYTVPAGFYSRVVISGTATSYLTTATINAGALTNTLAVSSTADSFNIDIFLKAGDALTSSLSNASGSIATGVTAEFETKSSTTTATLLINGVAIAIARAPITAAVDMTNAGATTILTFDGISSIGYIASEYNVIS